MSKPKTPSRVRSSGLVVPLARREIISELRGEVRTYQESYREVDGQIRDKGALRTIAALSRAIEIVKRHNSVLCETIGKTSDEKTLE